ncbi:MAG: hypothetical protein AAFS10_27490, partial [Myxococcota bacterium]
RIVVALCATLAAAAPALGKLSVSAPWVVGITTVLSIIVALISGYTIAAPPAQKANLNTMLRQRWTTLRYDLEQVYTDLSRLPKGQEVGQLADNFGRLMDRKGYISLDQPPAERKLLIEAQEQVMIELGHRTPTQPKLKQLTEHTAT